MNNIKYPLAKGHSQEEINELIEWLKTGPRLSKDKLTIEAEQKFAKWVGTKYAVHVNSGSSANLLAYYALLISNKLKNKKVVVPAVAWATTITPAINFGFEPIMVGPDKNTFGMDLGELETICKLHNPGLVIYVDVLGVPHYKEKLLFLKEKYGFMLINDSCAAVGSSHKDGTKCGSVGDIGCWSMYVGHQLNCIESGMIFTNDKHLYELLIMLRSHGWLKDLSKEKYDEYVEYYKFDPFHTPFTFIIPGFNVRSTEISAFFAIRQIDKLDEIAKKRHEHHVKYASLLPDFEKQKWQEGETVASISFGCLAKDKKHRKQIVEKLVENGIETRLFSAGNIGLHPMWYERYPMYHHITGDKIHDRGFFLPNDPSMTDEDIEHICNIVLSCCGE